MVPRSGCTIATLLAEDARPRVYANYARQPAQVDVIPALPADEPILANLLELYIHDFSKFLNLDLDVTGRFGYSNLPLYWRESNRHPFLIRMNGKLVGFVFVKRGSEVSRDSSVWDMAEFFIVRGYRRRGIGIAAAHEVWRRFRGVWEIRVMEANHPSHQFWERAVAAFVGKTVSSFPVHKGGKSWRVFSFESASE